MESRNAFMFSYRIIQIRRFIELKFLLIDGDNDCPEFLQGVHDLLRLSQYRKTFGLSQYTQICHIHKSVQN